MRSNWRRLTATFIVPVLLLSGGFVAKAQTYRVVSGDTLYQIASRHGITAEELARQNGLESATIYPGQTLSIRSSGKRYTVQPGDSLYLIAQRYGTSIEALKSANGMTGNYVEAGWQVVIPSKSSTGSTAASYVVQPGDTLYLLATRYGTTVSALRSTNGLSGDALYPGQRLSLPAGGSGGSSSGTGWNYTVRAGDTLYLVAVRYGTTVQALRQANGLGTDTIYLGQSLRIPAGSNTQTPSSPSTGLSQADLELLARLVSAEASGEPYAGQVAVAATILNRLNDPKYPKTISNIVYQYTDGAYQYSPVMDGRINQAATSGAFAAVRDAVNGWDPSYGATGFYNPDKTDNPWVRSQPVTTAIGEHVFFRY